MYVANSLVFYFVSDMIVRFSSIVYFAFERDENIQVCADVETFSGEILRPFTIILAQIPPIGNFESYK